MRTDKKTLCARCAIRFAVASRCPRCGGTEVFDLTNRKARKAALKAIHADTLESSGAVRIERMGAAYLRYVLPALALLIFVYGAATQSMLAGAIMALIAAWVVLAALIVFVAVAYTLWITYRILLGLLRLAIPQLRSRSTITRIVASDEQNLLHHAATVETRGRVRVVEPARSPLGGAPCAAFRLVGQGPLGEIDDAGGVPFEVVVDDGAVVLVEPEPSSIALEVDGAQRPVRLDKGLTRFLEARGVFPERGTVRLAEAILADGDRVVVEGACETPDDGRRVFREKPGAPLVIRRTV